MKTVKPISAHSNEHTVTFAFSAFFVSLCVISLAGIPKPGFVASGIKNNGQMIKQTTVIKSTTATTKPIKIEIKNKTS